MVGSRLPFVIPIAGYWAASAVGISAWSGGVGKSMDRRDDDERVDRPRRCEVDLVLERRRGVCDRRREEPLEGERRLPVLERRARVEPLSDVGE